MKARSIGLSLLVATLLVAPVQPAAAFTRVPVSLMSDSDHPGPVVPDNKKKKKSAKLHRAVDPMKLIRNRMLAGKKVTYKEMQKLADSGDDLAAYYLAKRIEAENDPDRLDTAAHYYLRALHKGRDAALRPLVRLLGSGALDTEGELLADAQKLLEKRAADGDQPSVSALIAMYRSGTPFGAYPERADELLVAAAKAGDSKAALDLAYALLTGTPEPTELDEARGYLKIAALSDTLSVRTVAENLLRTLEPAPLTVATETVQ